MRTKLKFDAKDLVCCECNRPFVWTAGEQVFYWSKGLAPPKRCTACRERRKATLEAEVQNG
ncbi:zinc-ribbon domain containing protein [Chloroflexota bacterium]